MELNAFLKETHSFANAHKVFQVKDAKTKCQMIHVNRTPVKTEVFALIKVGAHTEWEEAFHVNVQPD